jgi:hypothetical protein
MADETSTWTAATGAESNQYLSKITDFIARTTDGAEVVRVWPTGLPDSTTNSGIGGVFTEDRHGRLTLSALFLVGSAITTQDLREIKVGDLERAANEERDGTHRQPEHAELDETLRASDPALFSERLAAVYLAYARSNQNAVAALAQDTGLDPRKVHSWVREARLRGLLPPSSRTKSGRTEFWVAEPKSGRS